MQILNLFTLKRPEAYNRVSMHLRLAQKANVGYHKHFVSVLRSQLCLKIPLLNLDQTRVTVSLMNINSSFILKLYEIMQPTYHYDYR